MEEPSLTRMATEGLKRFVSDSVPFPTDLLSLIAAFCIPATLFIVNASYIDPEENRLSHETAREEREDVWHTEEFITFLENQRYPPIASHAGQNLRFLLGAEPSKSLSWILMRLDEETEITLTVQQIDLLRNRQKHLEVGGEWSEWLPIQLHFTEKRKRHIHYR
jgi:hypothetical protein